MVVFGAGTNDATHMGAAVFAPIPHIEGVHAVVGVALAVEVNVAWVFGELFFIFMREDVGVAGFGEEAVEEFEVAGVVYRVKLIVEGVGNNEYTPLLQQGYTAVKVKEITLGHYLYEDRVKDRVNAIRADMGDTHNNNIRLSLNGNEVLAVTQLKDALMGGLRLAGEDANDFIGGGDALEDFAFEGPGGAFEEGLHGLEFHPVEFFPMLFLFGEEAELVVEHAAVEGGLNVEDFEFFINPPAHAVEGIVQSGAGGLHIAFGGLEGMGVVVVAYALVTRQPRRHRLMSPIHRDEVNVDINDEVTLRSAAVNNNALAEFRLAYFHHTLFVLGVVVIIALREEGVENFLAHHTFHFGVRHTAVQGVGDDEVDVVDARVREQLQDDFEDALPDVGRRHGGQGHRNVVDGDSNLHTGAEEGVEGVHLQGVINGPAYSGFEVGHALKGGPGENDAGADGQVFEEQVLAGEEEAWGGAFLLEDDVGVFVIKLL